MRDVLNRPVLAKGDGNWIDVLPKITKHYNNTIHTSAKLSPKHAYSKKNERIV